MEKEIEGTRSRNTTDDLALVERARQGDAKAHEKLVKKYRKSVYYMLLKMVNNADDAEDLTQEAFAKAFAALERYDTKYAFSTWLFRIATNNCIDHIRKRRVQTVSLDTPYHSEEGDDIQFDVRDSDLNPNEQMLRKQRKEYIKQAVEKLPKKFKVLVELRYFQEMSYEEVGEEMGMPIGTVKAQLFRAREMLLAELKNMEEQI
jgi:RNA polymerase sigma-70 factor (ECF subfamily)